MLCLLGSASAAVPADDRPDDVANGRTSEGRDVLSLKQAGSDFLRDAGQIWSSPARLRTKDIGPLISLSAVTGLLIALDEPIRDGIQAFAEKRAWVDDIAPVVTQMGGLAGFGTAAAFLGAGLIFKDAKARETGYLAMSSVLQSFLVENALKGLTGRQRPGVSDGEDKWSGPAAFFRRFASDGGDHYGSFPSGHTAAAFSLATVVAMQYGHHGWVPVVAYTLATGVGLSRMTMDRHWLSDVAIGALIGHLVARLVVRSHERRRRIVPALACTGRGFAFGASLDLGRRGF